MCSLKRDSKKIDIVLVISTGGTIAMVPDKTTNVLVPSKDNLLRSIRQLTQMNDEQYCREHFDVPDLLVLPDNNNNNNGKRIIYQIKEWKTPLDSSDLMIHDWIKIAIEIKDNYDNYVGFVILHGTDTMAYTASALSMMFENLKKPVVITGAQIPIFATRSDGINNFISSLLIAGTQNIPEVMLFFNNVLLRGNRSTKVSSSNFTAFKSPNYQPLAESGINLTVNSRAILMTPEDDDFIIHQLNNHVVVILHIHPGISIRLVKKMLEPPTLGVILLTYGAGNVPSNSPELIDILKNASNRNVIMVNISQCLHRFVEPIYHTGQILVDCNVIPGCDMTVEACYAKILYVLSRNDWNIETKREMMKTNLRGELTINSSDSTR